MRKTVSLGVIISLISCLFFSVTASATTVNDYNRTIEYLDNGDYIETIISDDETDSEISLFSTKSITKTKTSYYKNSSGTVLWSVAIKATFLTTVNLLLAQVVLIQQLYLQKHGQLKVLHIANQVILQLQKQQPHIKQVQVHQTILFLLQSNVAQPVLYLN